MADIELHASTCARCQSMLAAFAVGTPGTSGTFSWWKWWLAPVVAGATAVTLWMVVPEQQQLATAPPALADSTVAVDKVQPPAAIEEKKADAFAAPPAEPERRAREAESDVKENKLRADASRDDRQQLKDQAVAAPKQEIAMAQPSTMARPAEATPPPAAPAAPPAAAPAPASANAAREELAGARAA